MIKDWFSSLVKKNKKQNIEEVCKSAAEFIKEKIIKNIQINYTFNSKDEFLYNYTSSDINIPKDFETNKKNKELIEKTSSVYGEEQAIKIIAYHELGHLIHHSYLNSGHTVTPSRPYLIQSSNPKDTFTGFFNPKNNSEIDQFLHVNFAESYADCFSCLMLYLKDKSNCFSKVFNYREDGKNEEKKSFIEIKDVNQSGNLYIGLNNFTITEYFNYQAIKSFEDNFFNIFKDKISTLPYQKVIHQVIQNECIQELYNITINELNTNNLFLKIFSEFVKNNGYSNIQSYLNEFESHIYNFKKDTIKKIVLEDDYFKNTNGNKILLDMFNIIGKSQEFLDIESYVKDNKYLNESERKEYIIEKVLNNNSFKNQFLQKFCSSETMSYIENQTNRPYSSFNTNLKIKDNNELREELLNQLKVPKEEQKKYTFNLLLVEVWKRNQQSLSFNNDQEPLIIKYGLNINNVQKARNDGKILSNTRKLSC